MTLCGGCDHFQNEKYQRDELRREYNIMKKQLHSSASVNHKNARKAADMVMAFIKMERMGLELVRDTK